MAAVLEAVYTWSEENALANLLLWDLHGPDYVCILRDVTVILGVVVGYLEV